MSRPLGFVLVDMLFLRRGESDGDKDWSENAVDGESGPAALVEFQPKKEVNPPAGDLGLPCWPLLSGRYWSLTSSSRAPSTLSLRSGGLTSALYDGMFGTVGDREWLTLPSIVGRLSSVVFFRGWKVLTERSCLGSGLRWLVGSELLRAANELCGTVGVVPWGFLPKHKHKEGRSDQGYLRVEVSRHKEFVLSQRRRQGDVLKAETLDGQCEVFIILHDRRGSVILGEATDNR